MSSNFPPAAKSAATSPPAKAAQPAAKPAFGFRAGFLLGGAAPKPAPKPAPAPAPAAAAPETPATAAAAARAHNRRAPLVVLLETPGLAGEVLSRLTLREATVLRGTCAAAAAAVSAYPFAPQCADARVVGGAAGWVRQPPIRGGQGLARFLKALPAVQSISMTGALRDVTEAQLSRVAGRAVVYLSECEDATAAGCAGMTGLVDLTVDECPALIGGPLLEALPDPTALQFLRLRQDTWPLSDTQQREAVDTDAHLARFPHLRTLELDCWHVITPAVLRGLPALECLGLNVYSELRADTFAGLPSRLAALKLDYMPPGGRSETSGAVMPSEYPHCRVDGALLAPLAGSLRRLMLVDAELTGEGEHPLAPLVRLEVLRLTGVTGPGAEDEALADVPLPEEVILEDCEWTDFDLAIAPDGHRHRLASLMVIECPLFSGAGLPRIPSLRSLYVQGKFWVHDLCASLRELARAGDDGRCPRLHVIELHAAGPDPATTGVDSSHDNKANARHFQEEGSITAAFRLRGWHVDVHRGLVDRYDHPSHHRFNLVCKWIAWRMLPGGELPSFRSRTPALFATQAALGTRGALPVRPVPLGL